MKTSSMATASGKWLKALMALPLFLFAFLLLPTSCSEESDEVEEFPRAREAIKHLVEDGRYDYIETGSLISTVFGNSP